MVILQDIKTIRNTTKILVIFFIFYCYSENNTAAASFVQTKNKNTEEFVQTSNLKSVKTGILGQELADPVIELYGSNRILVSFDDLSDNPGTYSYSLLHCDSEWKPSSLFFSDYMDGFEVNELRDYTYSSGTITSFMHCRIELPNQDVKIKISGNYLLRVFNSYEPDEILIQRRFIIYEPLTAITTSVRQPSAGEQRYSGQQLNLKINTSGLRVSDPFAEIKTYLCQNCLFQGCFERVTPVYVKGGEIDYSQPSALIFDGGNEFRLFDIKNIRFTAQGVQSIDYIGGLFHVQITPDQSRRRQRYSKVSDLNGRYVISLEQSRQSDIEADYVWTYFTLKSPVELDEDKSVYLFGEFTGWQLGDHNRMIYNPERGSYELRLLLKQGLYNYRYLVANNKTGAIDITQFEGNFFETENSYTTLVYYKPLGARYERAVGYQKFSSVR